MNSCVSCLTWCIAIPVLFFATFVLGPWMLVLFGVVVVVALLAAAAPSSRDTPGSTCPTCGRPYGPPCRPRQ